VTSPTRRSSSPTCARRQSERPCPTIESASRSIGTSAPYNAFYPDAVAIGFRHEPDALVVAHRSRGRRDRIGHTRKIRAPVTFTTGINLEVDFKVKTVDLV